MKFLIFFTILASAVACVFACNPDGDNKPTCVGRNVENPIRNFQNDKAFWWCEKAGVEAKLVNCPNELVFDESSKACISPKYFTFTQPCKCNPDGTNKPNCDESEVEKPIRNFQNAKAFWWCKMVGVDAKLVYCPGEQVFDESRGACVSPKDFTFTEPCS